MTSSWGLLRLSWSLLGSSWGPLGASWGALGWVLGPLGRLLGRLRGDPNVTTITRQKKVIFQTPQRRVLFRYGGGLGRPKSTKIGPKTSQNSRRFSRAQKIALQDTLGAVLSPSWAASTSKIVLWPTRRSFFQKSHFLNKSRSEAQLGRQKCRK